MPVRFADVGDQSEIGLCDRAQQRDLSAMTRTHLHDAEFRRTVHRQQRQRHSDVVVEISLRDRYAVFPFQRPADQFFGRRFSVAARNREDRNPQLPAVACGQFLQCFQRIGYDEIVRLFRRGHSVRYRRVVYDRRRRSRSDRRRRIAVAVERFPVQRKENSSRDDLPAIVRDAREFAI